MSWMSRLLGLIEQAPVTPKWVKKLPSNKNGRDFIIGDLHGSVDLLIALMRHVHFDYTKDRVFSVGDLIDRGPDSLRTLQLIGEPWFFAVQGNHEYWLKEHFKNPASVEPYEKGWIQAACSDPLVEAWFRSHWALKLEELPLVIRVGEGDDAFHIIHAEIFDDEALCTDQMIEQWQFKRPEKVKMRVLEGRHLIKHYLTHGKVKTLHHPRKMSIAYCGHSIVPAPMKLGRQVFIDTGAFLSGNEDYDYQAPSGLTMIEHATQVAYTMGADGLDDIITEDGPVFELGKSDS